MPVDLVGPIIAWLVSTLGDSGVGLVRSSRDKREFRHAVRGAVEVVAREANLSPETIAALQHGIRRCFLSPPRLRPDSSVSVAEGLRTAIITQLASVEDRVSHDIGRPFHDEAGVEPGWLTVRIADSLIEALRQYVAARSVAELVHGLNAAELSARLEDLGRQVRGLAVPKLRAVTRDLPRDIATFIGRDAEIDRLIGALNAAAGSGSPAGVHAIDGMAGVGKTAFAVHAAHRLAQLFPDGQLFVRLHAHTPGQRPVDPADALAILLLGNGVDPQQMPGSLEARASLWRNRVADAKVLLVLDDAVGHDQVRPLLPGSAGSLILVTSRRRILALDDAVSIRLDQLRPDKAAELFVRLAGRSGLDPTDHVVADIVRLCGCLPLAIRLIAAQMASHPAWTAADLAEDMAAGTSRLIMMRTENVSVSAAFDLSYEQLESDQQQLFRRLSLHPGTDIDAYAAAALADIGLSAAQRQLSELYDRHLLDETAHGRYRFHDLIKEHARALSQADPQAEKDAAMVRLLSYYQHAAASADLAFSELSTDSNEHAAAGLPDFASHRIAMEWLEAERLNLAAAIEYAAANHHYLAATEIGHAITSFAERHGYRDQALVWQRAALASTRAGGDQRACARVLNDMAVLQSQEGDFAAAAIGLSQALQIFTDLGDQAGQAETLMNTGIVQLLTGDLRSSIANMTTALDLYRRLGKHHGQAVTLIAIGEAHWESGNYRATADASTEALRLFRELGSRLGQANAFINLGVAQSAIQDTVAADASFDRALRLFRDLGDPRGEATVLLDIGMLQESRKQYEAAAASFEEALAIFRNLSSRLGESKALGSLGHLKYLTRDYAGALVILNDALVLFRELGDHSRETWTLRLLSEAQAMSGLKQGPQLD